MKQVVILFCGLLLFSCEKETIKPNPDLKESFTITSKESRRAYDISVQLPHNYHETTDTYATMYVLDAERDEAFVSTICKKKSDELNTQNIIVIGIGYKNNNERDKDYTPTLSQYGKGESPSFLAFIKKELIPRIQADYRADTLRSKRIIIGHSFGGLLGLLPL